MEMKLNQHVYEKLGADLFIMERVCFVIKELVWCQLLIFKHLLVS